MHIDEDAVRRRAHRIWEAEGQPQGREQEHWRRARTELEEEFRRVTEHAAHPDRRLDPPLHVEEALDHPGQSMEPGGDNWATGSAQRGAP